MILTSDWVIQRVMKPGGFARNRRWQYLPWAGYASDDR